MQPQIDTLTRRCGGDVAFWPHVEADDDGIGCRCQEHVGLGNTTDSGKHDLHLHGIAREVPQGVADRLDRALRIRPQNHRQLHPATLENPRVEVLEGQARTGRKVVMARLELA